MAAKFAACLFVVGLVAGAEAARVSIINRCSFTVWPGAIPGGGRQLKSGKTWNLNIPAGTASTRFWGRTGCQFDKNGRGRCVTGDCGNVKKCQVSGQQPTTLAEITFGRNGVGDGKDYLDISLVDGFNLPVSIVPTNNKNRCTPNGRSPSCSANINSACPSDLKVPEGCASACAKFNTDLYCCRGPNNTPQTCQPSKYSEFFKRQCPDAYSYAYDDQTSTFTCPADTNYNIVFCP